MLGHAIMLFVINHVAPPRKGGKAFFPAEAGDVGEDVMAAPSRKGGKTFFPAEAGDVDKDVMAAPPRKGGSKTFSLLRQMRVGQPYPG
jgi:hypothetical protein